MPKKENIQAMFDSIAPTYDKLNHTLSLNIDKIWRKKAVSRLTNKAPQIVLDVACGTGDSSIAIAKAGVPTVVGIDISEGMLEIARIKAQKYNYDLRFDIGDAQNLPFENDSIDAALIAFGIRNFEDKATSLKEILRVLKPGAKLIILELSVPQAKFPLMMYKLYFLHILPLIGKLISGSKDAYTYLPHSVLNFPKPKQFMRIMTECGYSNVRHKALSLGLCRLFEAEKS